MCGTTPCRLNGAEKILSTLEEHLGVRLGGTTPCGTFTLGEMECMGCCVNAPMIVVSDYSKGAEGYSYNYYEDLSPADAVRIADTYKAGAPKPPLYSAAVSCERIRLLFSTLRLRCHFNTHKYAIAQLDAWSSKRPSAPALERRHAQLKAQAPAET